MDKYKLVLLSCCTPCSCGAIEQLSKNQITNVSDFIVMFFNPNIFPETEYKKRLDEQIKYCNQLNVKTIICEYNHKDWLEYIKGLEKEPEKGKRCSKCFEYRFKYAEEWAFNNGYNAISSVFGVSFHKDQNQVNESAKILNKIKYLDIKWDCDLRKNILKNSYFYKQNYCGCEFSIRKLS